MYNCKYIYSHNIYFSKVKSYTFYYKRGCLKMIESSASRQYLKNTNFNINFIVLV